MTEPKGILGKLGRLFKNKSTVDSRKERMRQARRRNTFKLEGRITSGKCTKYAINGRDFHTDEETWSFGQFQIGVENAVVEGTICPQGNYYARSIRVKKRKQNVFTLKGFVHEGVYTAFAIDGTDFSVDNDTWVVGQLEVGTQAEIKGIVGANERLYARKVTVNSFVPTAVNRHSPKHEILAGC